MRPGIRDVSLKTAPLPLAAKAAGLAGAMIIGFSVFVPMAWSQDSSDDAFEPLDIPYQEGVPDEAEEDASGDDPAGDEQAGDDLDFFDTLDFLEESDDAAGQNQDPTGEDGLATPADPLEGIDIESLPGLKNERRELDEGNRDWDIAVFRGLDKVTARVWMFEAPLDTPVTFGRFEIQVRRCNKRPPEEPPNTTAFVEVDEINRREERSDVFTGWMFASSPGLNAVEHPVYDVWLIDCKMSPAVVSAGIEANVDEIVESDVIAE